MSMLQVWALSVGATVLVLSGLAFLWLRMPVFHWYCRRCKKIVTRGRLHPRKCPCGGDALVAYFCTACSSWNTSPSAVWHCVDCPSKAVTLGAEYHARTGQWKWRNKAA
jgi:hypothetical protein